MATPQLATPRNPIVDIASIVSQLVPTFVGSGTQKSKSSGSQTGSQMQTRSADPQALAATQAILQQAMTDVNDPAVTEKIVQDIMTKAAIQFSPVLASQRSAGLYNSNVVGMLGVEQQARATAAAAAAVLENRQRSLATARAAAGDLIQATGTTQNTSTISTGDSKQISTGPAVSPTASLGSLGALGVLAGGPRLFKAGKGLFDSLFGKDIPIPGKKPPIPGVSFDNLAEDTASYLGIDVGSPVSAGSDITTSFLEGSGSVTSEGAFALADEGFDFLSPAASDSLAFDFGGASEFFDFGADSASIGTDAFSAFDASGAFDALDLFGDAASAGEFAVESINGIDALDTAVNSFIEGGGEILDFGSEVIEGGSELVSGAFDLLDDAFGFFA
jgi:hypothetical protein